MPPAFAFAYWPNSAIDVDHKGTITAGDLRFVLDRACHGPRWEEIVMPDELPLLDGSRELTEGAKKSSC